jgi:transcriptional regulator with XRE-family HTH domain
MKTLGQELRSIRDLKKLSLREVEAGTGISNAYLSQLENDKIRKPSPLFLSKLANLYNIPYEAIMRTAGYTAGGQSGTGPKTLAGEALWGEFDLSADEEQKLVDYLSFIRSQRKASPQVE